MASKGRLGVVAEVREVGRSRREEYSRRNRSRRSGEISEIGQDEGRFAGSVEEILLVGEICDDESVKKKPSQVSAKSI